MNKNRKTLFFHIWLSAVMLLVYLATSSLTHYVKISNRGRVIAVGIVADVEFIDWGNMTPGQNKSYLIHVLRNGTEATLNSTLSWDPANASDYLTLSWNYTGEVLQPDVWIPIELYLHVAVDTPKLEFSFEMVIIAQEV